MEGNGPRDCAIFLHVHDPRFLRYCCTMYHCVLDPARGRYVQVMENLYEADVRLLNSVRSGEQWSKADVHTAVQGLAQLHAVHMGRCDALPAPVRAVLSDRSSGFWLGRDGELLPLWVDLTRCGAVLCCVGSTLTRRRPRFALEKQQHLVTPDTRATLLDLVTHKLVAAVRELDDPRHVTLIHGDISDRNSCLRNHAQGPCTLLTFDWELAHVGCPVLDVLDLYTSVACADWTHDDLRAALELHRSTLAALVPGVPSAAAWPRLVAQCTLRFWLARAGFALTGSMDMFPFLDRLLTNIFRVMVWCAPDL